MTDQTALSTRTDPTQRESIIEEGMVVEGRITYKGAGLLVIHGTVKGDIVSEGSVKIEQTGIVNGVLLCRNADIGGLVNCQDKEIQVRGLLHMRRTGVVNASKIMYGELEHERGARLAGALMPIDIPEIDRDRQVLPARPAPAAVVAPAAPVAQLAARPAAVAVPAISTAPQAARPVVPAPAVAPTASSLPHVSRVSVLPAHTAREETSDFAATQVSGLDVALPRVSRLPDPVTSLGDLDMPTVDLRPLRADTD